MSKNFLLIVEGAVTEKNIFKAVFEKIGIDVVRCDQISLSKDLNDLFANIYDLPNKDRVYVIQGPRNRISDWLKLMNTQTQDFDLLFDGSNKYFAGKFIIYDVDHTSNEYLEEMFEKYQDESDEGLLLLSSPCIEVIADVDRSSEPLICSHLKEYKSLLNVKYNLMGYNSAEDYIIKNFGELILYYLNKNYEDSKLANITEHPKYIISEINKYNDRNDGEDVCYRYFTTVIYVCIAYIKGLTKTFDNYEIVKNFFENQ